MTIYMFEQNDMLDMDILLVTLEKRKYFTLLKNKKKIENLLGMMVWRPHLKKTPCKPIFARDLTYV